MKKKKANFTWNDTIQELAKLRKPVVIESVCERCGEEKEINGVSGYCDDCRPKNR
jgi:hypothetical protein